MTRNYLFKPAVRSPESMRVHFEINSLLSLALGATFLGTGIAKILASDFVIDTFTGWNMPTWTLIAIGVVEILAAVFTLIPTTRLLGTGLIASVMVGAIGYHIARAEWLLLAIPVTALLVALTSLYLEVSLRRAEQKQPAEAYVS